MIIKKEKKGNVTIYVVEKKIMSENIDIIRNKFLNRDSIDLLIDHDADVYGDNGVLLVRFRKHILPKKNTNAFYDNVIKFARNVSTNRGNTTGSHSKTKNVRNNPKIMSNILGYYDKWGPAHKSVFKRKGVSAPMGVHETKFLKDYPDLFKKCVPLIQDIDKLYKKLLPKYHTAQFNKANKTPFRIANTSFTTITTNVNFQTTVHLDKGDDIEGFGNLTVIERGSSYKGAETCFPRYGVAIDVREGDMLFMNVHEWHGNLPMLNKKEDTERLSIVCYLRTNVYEKTKNMTKAAAKKHNAYITSLFPIKVKPTKKIKKKSKSKTLKNKK